MFDLSNYTGENLFCRSNFSAAGSANAMYSALGLDEKETEDTGDTVLPSASKPGKVFE